MLVSPGFLWFSHISNSLSWSCPLLVRCLSPACSLIVPAFFLRFLFTYSGLLSCPIASLNCFPLVFAHFSTTCVPRLSPACPILVPSLSPAGFGNFFVILSCCAAPLLVSTVSLWFSHISQLLVTHACPLPVPSLSPPCPPLFF